MGQFDHYPDMNHDGKKDIYDCVVFHELMDEDEQQSGSVTSPTEPIRPRDLTEEQRKQLRLNQQIETTVKWIMVIVFAVIALVCFKNINGFTALLGLFSVVAVIRTLTL